jgi:hypothetical protein
MKYSLQFFGIYCEIFLLIPERNFLILLCQVLSNIKKEEFPHCFIFAENAKK